jgi:hypothetical protein
MPLSVADLQGAPVAATLHLAQGDIAVTWYPGHLTGRILRDIGLVDRLDSLPPDEVVQALEQASSILATLLHSWDVTESDPALGVVGKPVALTCDRLAQFGLPVLWAILMALISEGRMGEANGTPSPAPSPATTRTARRAGSRR